MFEWSRHFGVVAIVPFVLANAAFTTTAGALLGACTKRGVRSPWLVAAVWVVVEGLRARFPFGGLPWAEVGMVLHDRPWGRALATWGGIPLASFLIVAVNGWLLELGIALVRRRRVWVPTVALGAVIGVVFLATALRPTATATGHVRVALLQGNDQDRELTADEVANDFLLEAHFALADQLDGPYDLVVFPESAFERDPERNPDLRDRVVALADRLDATVVVNARTVAPGGGRYNANLVYDADGTRQGQYAKRHLVPFGEYVPFRWFVGRIPGVDRALDQIAIEYTAGDRRRAFRAGGHRFETVICFESAFASTTRDAARDGAELIVVTTNNRSYRRSGLSAQHVALGQMRAAETGRPVVHAAISGISALIDADGRVHERTELFERTITEGVVTTTTGTTPFVRLGDWVLAACVVGLVGTAVVAQRRWVRRDAGPPAAGARPPAEAPVD